MATGLRVLSITQSDECQEKLKKNKNKIQRIEHFKNILNKEINQLMNKQVKLFNDTNKLRERIEDFFRALNPRRKKTTRKTRQNSKKKEEKKKNFLVRLIEEFKKKLDNQETQIIHIQDTIGDKEWEIDKLNYEKEKAEIEILNLRTKNYTQISRMLYRDSQYSRGKNKKTKKQKNKKKQKKTKK